MICIYLGSKRGGSSNLASDGSQVDELDLIGVKLGSHGSRFVVCTAENAETVQVR